MYPTTAMATISAAITALRMNVSPITMTPSQSDVK
jgi:hypothetical protein